MRVLSLRTCCASVAFAALFASGCGGPAWDPGSVKSSFASIEASVEDIARQITTAKQKKGGARDLGSDSDRIGFTLSMFLKSAEGTPVYDDAKTFEKRFFELETLYGSRAPMDQVQTALKSVQDSLATIKAKL